MRTIELYRDWSEIRDKINHGDLDTATEARLYVDLYELEKQIVALPSVTATDLAVKYQVITDCDNFEVSEAFGVECQNLVRAGVEHIRARSEHHVY